MPHSSPDVTIIIPAYNEQARLVPTLAAVSAFMDSQPFSHEVIVIDDGSADGTFQVARAAAVDRPHVRVLRHPVNLGKGAAVKTGFMQAAGELVFFSDADLSTPIAHLPDFIAHARRGNDIVIGSRALEASVITQRQRWYRENMGRMFNRLVRMLVLRGLRDTQCGFKCFHRKTCLPVFELQRLVGFCFDVELLFIARSQGLKILEVPVTWHNSPDSRVHALRDSVRMFLDLLRIRANGLAGRYRRTPPARPAEPGGGGMP